MGQRRARPALRAAAERRFARNDRTTQGLLGPVVGRLHGGVDQPDDQIIQVFGDPCGQLLRLPAAFIRFTTLTRTL
jgi:hypothetical protein